MVKVLIFCRDFPKSEAINYLLLALRGLQDQRWELGAIHLSFSSTFSLLNPFFIHLVSSILVTASIRFL